VRQLAEEGAYDGCDRCPRAFATVGDAAATFVQQIIAGDGWGTVCMPLIDRYPLLLVFFILVIMSVDVGILNLLTSAVVDNVHERREQNDKLKIQEKKDAYCKARKTLTKLCHDMDKDGNGLLTLEEIKRGYSENVEFFNMLRMLDVELDDMSLIFKALDGDNSGSVSHEEFVNQLYKLKSQDTHSLLIFIKCFLQDLSMNQQQSLNRVQHSLKTDAEMHKAELTLLRTELAATESLRKATAVLPSWQQLQHILPVLDSKDELNEAASAEVLRNSPTDPSLSTSAESPGGDLSNSDAAGRSLVHIETNDCEKFVKVGLGKDACTRSPQRFLSQDADLMGSAIVEL
jgi:Ca2+-binding EF-hand superfamily protein